MINNKSFLLFTSFNALLCLFTSSSNAIHETELSEIIEEFSNKSTTAISQSDDDSHPSSSRQKISDIAGSFLRTAGVTVRDNSGEDNSITGIARKNAGNFLRKTGEFFSSRGEKETLPRIIIKFWAEKIEIDKHLSPEMIFTSTASSIFATPACRGYEKVCSTYEGFLEEWNNSSKITYTNEQNVKEGTGKEYLCGGIVRSLLNSKKFESVKDSIESLISLHTGTTLSKNRIKEIIEVEKANALLNSLYETPSSESAVKKSDVVSRNKDDEENKETKKEDNLRKISEDTQ